MMNVEIDIGDLTAVRKLTGEKLAALTGPEMVQTMRTATLIVTNAAKVNAPVDTGRLRASITPSVTATTDAIQGVVGSNVVYAPYVELGTRPHWPPVSALETWARSHGTSAFLVARAIARRGTKARKYLERAFTENTGRIVQLFNDAIMRIVNK